MSPHVEAAPRLPPRGVAGPARHLDRAAAPRRSRDRARRPRPAERDRRAVGARVPVDRGRRQRGVGPRPGDAGPRRATGPHTWQGVMLDITAQKEAEEQLRLTNDELEVRVLARTAELAEANELMALEIGERRRAERELREAEERYRQPRRGPARRRLLCGRPRIDDGRVARVHEPADRADPGLHAGGVETRASGATACTRTTASGCWRSPCGARRPASRSTPSTATCQGRAAWSGCMDRAVLLSRDGRRRAPGVPGRHARHHRAKGSRAEGRRGRGAVPGARGAGAGGHLRRTSWIMRRTG